MSFDISKLIEYLKYVFYWF